LADAFDAHDEAMSFGGREGVNSLHLIESALARPYSGYHRSIHRKAAAILHSMVGNHGFVDGNKRTALLLTIILIRRSGYDLINNEQENIDDLVVAVADNQLSFEELSNWFEERLKKFDD
jgi:death-on-curing protein